ncbi:MAG: cell division protein FtsQ/DivIB [Candidatus Omnitrophica bacterium]|nr:cell division protein FtsQ/DivIB [Candidatus Omnitrophota bacterium]
MQRDLFNETQQAPPGGVKLFSMSMISGLLLFIAVPMGLKTISSHPRFLVREAEIHWPDTMKKPVERYKITPVISIFEGDLREIGAAFQSRFPTAQVTQVIRCFPNRIVVQMQPRQIVAQVQAGRFYPVSEEGVIVAEGRSTPWQNLPIFHADGLKGKRLSVSQTIENPAYQQTFEILAAIQRLRGVAGRTAAAAYCREPDILIALNNGTEIRFHAEKVRRGWEQLTELLIQKREMIMQAKYIDLRFDDPVINK